MKKIISVASLLFCLSVQAQNVSNEVIKSMANWNCKCQDTISTDLPISVIEDQIFDCFNKSFVTFYNNNELPHQIVDDKAEFEVLQKNIINELANCENTKRLLAVKKNDLGLKDSVPEKYFITKEFFEKNDLFQGQVSSGMRVWNNKSMDKIQRVVDIRWVFENKQQALNYHNYQLGENSEGGKEIKVKTKVKGIDELHVYTQSEEMDKMMKSLGISQQHYYFIFVWEHVVCKIFIATDGEYKMDDVVFIFEEAVQQLEKSR